MFLKYLDISFPLSNYSFTGKVSYFCWNQAKSKHDFGLLRFTDWNIDPAAIAPTSPVVIKATVEGSSKTFYGYIHNVNHVKSSHKNYTDIHIIGASYYMKQASQTIYHNMTASDVAIKLAKKYRFDYDVAPHGRIYPQISQAGKTDWELLCKLAHDCGYIFRVDGTTLHFKPIAEDFNAMKSSAKEFFSVPPGNPTPPRLYSIKPIIGESVEYEDGYKTAVAVSGMDPRGGMDFTVINPRQPIGLRGKRNPDLFDRYDMSTTVTTRQAAVYEALAAEARNKYPYRAQAKLFGTPELRPDMPVYISNVDKQLNGYWSLVEVNHVMTDSGFVTEAVLGIDSLNNAEAPPSGSRSPGSKQPKSSLSVSGLSIKPTSFVKGAKVSNRLSDTPAVYTQAQWVGSGLNLRGYFNKNTKVSEMLS